MTITEHDENVQNVSGLNQFISDPNSAKNKRSDKKHFTQTYSYDHIENDYCTHTRDS